MNLVKATIYYQEFSLNVCSVCMHGAVVVDYNDAVEIYIEKVNDDYKKEDICDSFFRKFNMIDSETQKYINENRDRFKKIGHTSMSVGDFVQFDDEKDFIYVCANTGWIKVDLTDKYTTSKDLLRSALNVLLYDNTIWRHLNIYDSKALEQAKLALTVTNREDVQKINDYHKTVTILNLCEKCNKAIDEPDEEGISRCTHCGHYNRLLPKEEDSNDYLDETGEFADDANSEEQ